MKQTPESFPETLYTPANFPIETAPTGRFEAIFIQGFWGKSSDLFCCFETDDGVKFRVSTFCRNEYRPYRDGPNMRYARHGERYLLEIKPSETGNPVFLYAERI